MTHINARLSRLERQFLPSTHTPISVHIVANDEEEAAARRAILAEGGPDDDHIHIIRIIRLAAPETSR
jgi:hypothetical protein